MQLTAKAIRNFVLLPALFVSAITAQTTVCLPSIKSQAVSDCSQKCGDDGDCIFGCESGQFSSVDECYTNCNLFGPTCIPACISTVTTINEGCTGTTVVTANMSLKLGTIAYNRATGVWQQTVVVTNTSKTTLSNLGYILDSLAPGWTMTNADGITNQIAPVSAYKNFGALAPNASATVTLQFTRTGTTGFSYSPRVLSGTAR